MRNKMFVTIIVVIIVVIPIIIFIRVPKVISVTENRILMDKSSIKFNKNINENLNKYLEDQFIFRRNSKKDI